MSPEFVGIIIGVIFVVPAISFIEKRGYGRWAWPIFLVTLPIYYMAFGLVALTAAATVHNSKYRPSPVSRYHILSWLFVAKLALVLVVTADFDLGPSAPLQAISERLQPG